MVRLSPFRDTPKQKPGHLHWGKTLRCKTPKQKARLAPGWFAKSLRLDQRQRTAPPGLNGIPLSWWCECPRTEKSRIDLIRSATTTAFRNVPSPRWRLTAEGFNFETEEQSTTVVARAVFRMIPLSHRSAQPRSIIWRSARVALVSDSRVAQLASPQAWSAQLPLS